MIQRPTSITGTLHPSELLQILLNEQSDSSRRQLVLNQPESILFELARYAADALVLPSLYPVLTSIPDSVSLPEELHTLCHTTFVANETRNQALLAEFEAVSHVLEKVSVPCIPLKGIALLLHGVYPNLGERVVSDLDVAIPAMHLTDTLLALKAAGFLQARNRFLTSTHSHAEFSPIDIDDFRNTAPYIDSHVPRIRHPSSIATIELHIHVTTRTSPLRNWLNKECFSSEKGAIEMFHLMHNFEHTHIKDAMGRSGIVDWRHLLDASHLLNRSDVHTQASNMMEIAESFGLSGDLAVHFWQLEKNLGVTGLQSIWQRPKFTSSIRRVQHLQNHRTTQRLFLVRQTIQKVMRGLFSQVVLKERYGPIPLRKSILESLRFYVSQIGYTR